MRLFLFILLLSVPAFAGNLVNPYVFSAPASVELTDIAGLDVEQDFDATMTDSYNGTGTTWTNRITAENDLTMSGFTFVGTAGDSAAYFDVDAADYAYVGTDRTDATDNPAWVDDAVNNGQDTDYWFAFIMRTGDDPAGGTTTDSLIGTRWSGTTQQSSNRFSLLNSQQGGLRHYSNSATPVIDPQFMMYPNQEVLLMFSYDDSADTMRIYYDSVNYYEVTDAAGHTTNGASVALHIMSDSRYTWGDDNTRLYAFSAGQGLLTETQATEIAAVYAARHSRDYVPSGTDCTGKFSNCIDDVFMEFLANDTNSYPGTGSTWANVAVNPWDGAAQTDYDATITGLTFTGTAGTAGAYFATDGSSYASFTLSADQHALYTGVDYTSPNYARMFCGIALRTPSDLTDDPYFFGNVDHEGVDSASVETGFGLRYRDAATDEIYGEVFYIAQEESHSLVQTLTPDTDYALIYQHIPYDSLDSSTDSQAFYINSMTSSGGISNNFSSAGVPTTIDQATGDWVIGGTYTEATTEVTRLMGSGGRIYSHFCTGARPTPANIKNALTAMENNANIDFDGDSTVGSVTN